jgi:hypothetical protein
LPVAGTKHMGLRRRKAALCCRPAATPEKSMLALQLVIGVGIALLFPLLVYSGVATFRSPPKPSNRTNLVPETSEEAKEANREQIRREQEELRRARVAYAKLLFTVMAPAGFVAVLAGYLIGVSAIGIGLLSGGILCMVYGYAGYWEALPQAMRFASTLAGFLMLLFIGLRYFGL